jgi:hypothetical protein
MSLEIIQSDNTVDNNNAGDEIPVVQFRRMTPVEIESLKQRVDEVKREFENYRYRLDIDQAMMDRYVDFITTKAEFDGKDALGIPKVYEALQDCIKEGNKVIMGGRPQFTLSNMHLEALYYYLTKVKGVGLQEANVLNELLNPVLDSLSRAVVRRNTLQAFLEKAEAKLHGIIDPDENIDPEYEENAEGE